MTFKTIKFILITSLATAGVFVSSGCTTSAINDSDHFEKISKLESSLSADQNGKKSNEKGIDYIYGDFYLSANGNKTLFESYGLDLNKCLKHNIEAAKKNGEGHKVFKSFGYSDEDIIVRGAMLCMEVKGWLLYKKIGSNLKNTNNIGLPYESMSSQEKASADNLLIEQRKWYQKYAPDVL